ncbi:MAG: histidine phosphatase family protein [Steroidobacteraceae bacterium]|jgi:phosphohistidine phosphatase SixA|nr:histidine phosphatase family protein [Steroidobacteraceae bacterium]
MAVLLTLALATIQTFAADPTATVPPALIDALRAGKHVIVMRHAASPTDLPDSAAANADNPARERQLSKTGRAEAEAMGAALKRLGIPVTRVLSSPTYRARETVKYLAVGEPEIDPLLGDGSTNMSGVGDAEGAWLRGLAHQAPAIGNTLIVTHLPNLRAAFGADAAATAEGESLIMSFSADGHAFVEARVAMTQWQSLLR